MWTHTQWLEKRAGVSLGRDSGWPTENLQEPRGPLYFITSEEAVSTGTCHHVGGGMCQRGPRLACGCAKRQRPPPVGLMPRCFLPGVWVCQCLFSSLGLFGVTGGLLAPVSRGDVAKLRVSAPPRISCVVAGETSLSLGFPVRAHTGNTRDL